MATKIQEAIDLLEKAHNQLNEIDTHIIHGMQGKDGLPHSKVMLIQELANRGKLERHKAIALLKPCPTCGGSKTVDSDCYGGGTLHVIQCPDCQSQEQTEIRELTSMLSATSDNDTDRLLAISKRIEQIGLKTMMDGWYAPKKAIGECKKEHPIIDDDCKKCVMQKICWPQGETQIESQEPEKPESEFAEECREFLRCDVPDNEYLRGVAIRLNNACVRLDTANAELEQLQAEKEQAVEFLKEKNDV